MTTTPVYVSTKETNIKVGVKIIMDIKLKPIKEGSNEVIKVKIVGLKRCSYQTKRRGTKNIRNEAINITYEN